MPKNTTPKTSSQNKAATGSTKISNLEGMPKASTETLSKLINIPADEEEYETKLHQVQECTACSLDAAGIALSSAGGDVQLAIGNLLDQKADEDSWKETTGKKSKLRRQAEQKAKTTVASLESTKADIVITVAEESVDVSNKSKSKMRSVNHFANEPRGPMSNGHDSHGHAGESDIKANTDGWQEECFEWKGEAIEIVNSMNDFPTNIHCDSELLRLVTTEVEETHGNFEAEHEGTSPIEEFTEEETTATISPVEESSAPQQDEESIKSSIFTKFARSQLPPASHLTNAPVFIVPEARTNQRATSAEPLFDEPTQRFYQAPADLQPPCSGSDPVKPENIPEIKTPRMKDQLTNVPDQIKSPGLVNYPSIVNPLIQQAPKVPVDIQLNQGYSPAPTNAPSVTEAYSKENDLATQSRMQAAPVNSLDNAYNYQLLLDEISQNMKHVGVDIRASKTDAFTQSLASNQSDAGQYHAMPPPLHQAKTQPLPPLPKSGMPPSNNQEQQQPSLPTTQPQMHPALHPGIPQLLSQFPTSFPVFNLHGSSNGPTPHMFDIDQFTAIQQQQRLLFEMQQQSQQQPQAPPQPQQVPHTVATEQSLPMSCADGLNSAKSGMPMHHVTTANVGPGITFLPYPSMVFMNGYPNTFMNQQQASQASGPQSQSSGHCGSPLTQQQINQQPQAPQFPKGMNTTPNYSGYQGLRQTSLDEMTDLYYQNHSKQVGYKHNMTGNSGSQGIYVVSQQQQNQVSKSGNGADMSALGSKMQQASSVQQPPQQVAVTTNTQQPLASGPAPPQALYSQQSLYQQQYFAMAAAAAAAQQQQQQSSQHTLGGMGGVPGMVQMHARPQH